MWTKPYWVPEQAFGGWASAGGHELWGRPLRLRGGPCSHQHVRVGCQVSGLCCPCVQLSHLEVAITRLLCKATWRSRRVEQGQGVRARSGEEAQLLASLEVGQQDVLRIHHTGVWPLVPTTAPSASEAPGRRPAWREVLLPCRAPGSWVLRGDFRTQEAPAQATRREEPQARLLVQGARPEL